VTDRRSVLTMYQSICKTMPSIAGVCNGAMIMNDGIIPHMTYERFNQTLRPKVDGTRFLNDIFDKPTLDFFIVFSSLAYVTGNLGQSPYAAANAFMVSIVEGRRSRGLAGSIMNLAGISGLGYISRTDLGILDRLARLGYSNMSEWDFLQFFAEAVLAGKPGSRSEAHDISSSLHPYDAEQETNPPAWLPLPAFSYYKRTARRALDVEDSQETSVRVHLKRQTTKEGISNVIQAGLSAMLYKLLNIRPEDATIRADTRLVDLGIDSLVAVDMRSWFSKELDLDMPVLKLLGGATVEEMVQDTIERLSPDLTPKLKAEDGEVLEQEESSPEVQFDSTSGSSPPSSASDTKSVSSPSSISDDGISEDGKPIKHVADPGISQELVFERKQSMGYPSLQFWFLLQQRELLSAFNCTFRIACRGQIDVGRMSQAVKQLGERHDSMRTAFFDDASNGYEPTQATLAPSASPLRLETHKVSNHQEAVQFTDDLHQRYVFDLGRGEVVRIALLSENDQSHYLVIGIHHIAIDGYSFFLFLKELIELYGGRQLEPVQMQWNDIIKEQKLAVDNGSMASEVTFWRKQLIGQHGVPEPLPMLPFAKVQTRVPVSTFTLEEVPMVTLDPALVRAIRERCRKLKVTRFHFFMTVLRLMLMELADVDELCIGMVDAGRTDVRSTKLVGLMVNVLPLRFQKKHSQSFAQICLDVRNQAYQALAHSRLPFKAMLEQLGVPLSNHAAPIFQVMMDYLPQNFETSAFAGTATDAVKSHLNYSLTDMVLDVNDISDSEIKFRWSAQTDLYSRDAVQTLMNTYVKLTERFAKSDTDCAAPMESIERISELYDANQVKDAVTTSLGDVEPENLRQTVSHIIQEISLETPDVVALKDGSGTTLTYSQMAQRVRQIELALTHPGEKLERVACYQQPTVDWICSLLAVWKVGATYISLDSRLPESRILTLLDLSKPSAIICCPETLEVTKKVARDCRVLDVRNLPQVTDSQVDIKTSAALDCPALMIFTSGSTGTPKCVEICHSSLANVIKGSLSRHCLEGESLVALQQSAVSFDLCFGQVLMGLCSGGSVVVASKDQRSDPQEICKIIRDESVSFIIATPSELAHWFRYGKTELNKAASLRYAFAGGEALPYTLKTSFRQLNKDVKLVNVYGPAEASVWCTTAEIDYSMEEHEDISIPVGRPMANCGVFVVDKNLKPVPSGVSGEIAVTGAGVANGYFGQEVLARAVFLADSLTPTGYFSQGAKKNQMYRTGDSGRFGADGQLYYEGRIEGDSQIKLNGIRIEIREVESAILRASHGVLGNAVVSARRNPDFLVGHVEFEPGYYGPQEKKQFLESLVSRLPLPKYMCPAILVPLDRIPVNAHGKTDRLAAQALPLPSLSGHHEDENDATKTEKALLEIWTEVLPGDLTQAISIRPETDFFSLGGGSYLLVRVQRLIRDRFCVSIPVRELFGTSTLREMASSVDAATAISAIDWQTETALDGISGDGTDLNVTAPVKTSGMTVVLTGATGYLGRHILKTLLENPAVSTIHCVAVRDETRVQHLEGNTTAQVVVHTGNLSAPLLGLSTADFNKLASEADVLIHSGADRSFWDTYHTLRGANLVSTKTMIQMAARRHLPLHFISSGGLVPKLAHDGVTGAAAGPVTGQGSPPADGSNGYIASKWASEATLERAARDLDVPVRIHRVTGADSTMPEALAAQLRAEFRAIATELKAVPHSRGWRGSFDVLRTSALCATLAKNFVGPSQDEDATSEERIRYFHYPSEIHLDIDVVSEVFEGIDAVETLPPHLWVGRAKTAGIDWHFSGQDFEATVAEGFALKR
jgi:hybrid polyketide synthase/nonribosomal peptide synthetase ACE1